MNWTLIIAVVVVVIIIMIMYKQWQWKRKYSSSRFGYFMNQAHLGAIFPQTGEPLIVAQIAGQYVVVTIDKTASLVAKPYPEFGGRFIVVPGMETPTTPDGITLYACATTTETIDPKATARIYATLDDDTKMPIVKLGDATNATEATWKFHPVMMGAMERLRRLFGVRGGHNIFTEMPSQFPSWATTNTDFANALKSGTFTASLKNLKYPGLQYPAGTTKMKPWGPSGIVFISNSATTVDPQILLVPTGTNMVFRAFSLQTAAPNKDTGKLEGYTQLVATNGTTFTLSKTILDTDAARWTLLLAPQ